MVDNEKQYLIIFKETNKQNNTIKRERFWKDDDDNVE